MSCEHSRWATKLRNRNLKKCAEKKQKRVSCSLDGKFDPVKENVMMPAKLRRTNPVYYHIKN
ncbi:hypothetical protein DPMN_068160 [Dreissena polymorpha]|uniref:Uncharacterized protein n=1 Tax=Dreissena polymorpha TaxID=45954 RepID=A0A9D3Z1P8_DREPO|nr:hypothetical protein DPMN_068160 [Dreissena polymorpha]